jgi:hypothetical protein
MRRVVGWDGYVDNKNVTSSRGGSPLLCAYLVGDLPTSRFYCSKPLVDPINSNLLQIHFLRLSLAVWCSPKL